MKRIALIIIARVSVFVPVLFVPGIAGEIVIAVVQV